MAVHTGFTSLKNLVLILNLLMSTASVLNAQKTDLPKLIGPYLGQKPPGRISKTFAPEIISTAEYNEFCASFSSDGKEFYFNRGMVIMVSRLEKDGWAVPEAASFNGTFRNHEAHLTFDNIRLFLGSSRPPQPYGIWLTERTDSGWTEPQRVADGMYLTSAANGSVYYGVESSSGSSVVKARCTNGRFSEPEVQLIRFADPDAGRSGIFHPAIAPDESFLVFDDNEGLFVCFRQTDGSWGYAFSLNGLLNKTNATIPSVSPDGRFLFFASQQDLHWVSTGIIQELKTNIH